MSFLSLGVVREGKTDERKQSRRERGNGSEEMKASAEADALSISFSDFSKRMAMYNVSLLEREKKKSGEERGEERGEEKEREECAWPSITSDSVFSLSLWVMAIEKSV